MAAKKKETREEIISRVTKEYNITPKKPSADTKGTIIASSKDSPSTYKANRSASEQKAVNQSIVDKYKAQYVDTLRKSGSYETKWYSGNAPTAAETMAQIFRQSSEDEVFFNKLNELFDEETRNSGSIIYSPYREPTIYKAVDGLRALGVDVPDVITADWIAQMQHDYADKKRTTATGYNAAAPTKPSSNEQDIAYWLQELSDAEAKTSMAEAQLEDLYKNVAYLTEKGYSDSEILKRIRSDFSSKYNVLADMDEKRENYGSLILNRAVDYNGDDTINGMIWAARNDGGSGSFFQDAVHRNLGQGNLYKPDPTSEAALDPSNYEGFAPYSRGSTLDDMNQKYGVNDFNQEWLDSNRSMLSDPEQAKDWRKIEGAVQNADKAASEIDGLNRWLDKMLANGESEEEIADALKAALDGDKELSYKDDEGHIQKFKPTTLGKMEESRARGEAMDLGYGVDFSLPAYLSNVSQMVIERDEAAAAAAAYNAKVEDVESFGNKAGRFFASMGVGVGSYGGNIDSVLKAKKGTYTEDEFARKFISDTFGIDYSGNFSPAEQAAIKDALEKVEVATNAKATTDEIIAANDAVDGLIGLMGQVANDPSRQVADESYADRESWTSVINSTADEPREGMAGFVPELTSATAENGEEPVDPKAEQEAALNAYAAMCQGGEWNTEVLNWAMNRSDNPAAIRIEITQGIIDHVQSGAPLTGLTKSWWDKFGGLVDDTGAPGDINAPGMTSSTLLYYADSNPESYDSRNAYGTSVYRAIKMNEDAYKAGVIEDAEYANNLWALSAIADGVNQAAEGERATDEIANAFLDESGYGMVLESMYQNINDRVLAGAKDRAMKRDQQIQENSEVIQRAISGQMLESDFPVYTDIVSADVGKIAARDKTYQATSAYITESLGFDAIAESGMQFTYGDKAIDASYGSELVLNEGASVYSKGVTALAQEQLDLHMKFAAACMMSLEEFYQKFPSYARTPEQLVAEAKEDYNGTWKKFGETIDGLIQANESIFSPNAAEGEEAVSNGELGPGTVFALGYDKVTRGNDLNLSKTLYFMRYAWKDEEYEKEQLLSKYGDRAGYAAELDRFVSEREAGLRNEYENDALARMNNLTYEQWLADHNDPVLDEILAKRDTAKDILEVGDPARLAAEDEIAQKIQNVAYVDKTVSEYGSEYDKKLFDITTMIMQTGQFMYTTAMLGGGYAGSLASMLTSSGGDAYDRFIESGDYDSALLTTTAAWLVNAAIEKMSYDRFMPEGMGGRRGVRMAKVQSMLAREGVYSIMKDPNKLSQAAVAVLEGLAVHGVSSGGEGLEEYLQQIVDSLADNVVYGTDYILSQEQQAAAGQAFWSGAAMGALFSSVSSSMFGRPKVTNRAGQAISKAEAELLPETEGVKLNDAITFEATNMAYVNSTEALAQIEDSSENAAKKKAEQDLKDANAELAEAQGVQAAAKEQHAAAALALEEVNIEMQDAEAFTEEMSKRMVTAAEALTKAKQEMDSANARLEAAAANQAKLQEAFDAAKGKVQQMYNSVMDAAKAKYVELVTEKYYEGDTPEQRKAGMAYQSACKNLEDAKNILLEAKSNLSKQTEGTAQANEAHIAHGEAVIAVNDAVDAVEATKAEMEAAYANAVEQTKSDVSDSLSRAQQAAEQAAAIAAADPANAQKQLAAQHAQAQANVIKSKQTLEDRRADLSIRLKSADDTERADAVAEWKELQQAVNDAESELNAIETEFNETNPQKNLRSAIDNMKQYSNMDLMDENSANHEAAVEAYNELLAAEDAVRIENAQRAMDEAYANMDASKPETVETYREARKQYNFAIDNGNSMNYTNNGEVYENESKGLYSEDVLGASGFEGEGSGSGAPVRGASAVSLYGDRRAAGRQDARGDRSGRRIDGSVRYESTTGITDVSATPEAYVQALEAGKAARPEDGHQVSPHSVEDVAKHGLRPFLTGDQLAGFAVEPNGNITGVFKNPASKLRRVMDDMMLTAIQEGGDRLDCYAGDLFNTEASASQRVGTLVNKYAKYGFEPVAVVKYNAEYAESDKVQDIVFFIHNGKSAAEIQADLANGDYEQYSPEQLLALKQFGPEDYEAAMQYRDSLIEQRKPSIQAWRNTGAGFGDHRGPGRTGEVTTADRNPIEILSDLTRSIGVGYNPGGDMSAGNRRLPRAVMAFYNRHARSITSRTSEAGDLAIGLHEFGHAVQARMTGLHASQQLINNLSQDVRNEYDPAEWDGEAFAEFVVDYIFNRDEAVRMAGDQFVREFEDALRADRPLYNAVMNASHQTELWNNADIGSKLGSMTKDSSDSRRGQIGNWLQRTARRIETAVADLTAPADMVSRDFRRRALYTMHASRRADVALSRFLIDPNGRNIGQSLAERFYRAGVTEADQAEVSRYALARHALDRRMQNRDVFDEHEFPTSELEAYVANAPDNIVAGADALTSFWSDFMDAWWVETGMIDADAVAEMRAMYPHYVPTFRVMGENFNQYGGQSSRFEVRRAVEGGSSLEVIDPLVSIVKMTQQMVSTVTQNQLMQAFHNEMRQGGLGYIADDVTQQFRVQRNDTTALQNALDAIRETGADPALMDDAYAAMLDLQERWIGTGQNYGPNVVSGVDERGVRFFYQIKDRDLFRMLSGTANRSADMGSILRVARNFKNTFTALTTSSNPLFALKNMQRDIQASVNTGTHSLTYAGGVARMVGALYDIATGNQTFRDWQAMGGGEHTRFSTELGDDAGRTTRNLARGLMRGRETRRGEFRNRSTVGDRIMNTLTWEKLNNAVENASRYMEYKYGRHDLTSDEGRREAFMASQDVTTNFGTHGASGVIRVLNQVVPFMNATIQGLNKDINIIRDIASGDQNLRRQAMPKLAKTVMNTALTAMLQYGLLKMFGGDEDDEDYALLSQEMRLGNLIIPIPKAAMEVLGDQIGFDKPYIRIPIAQGPMTQSAYAMMLDTVSNVSGYTEMEIDLWKATKTILTDVIPDGTVFQGLIDARNNRTWYGGEIESEYQRKYSAENRYDADTPQMFVAIGKRLGVSPAKLEYLANQYTGFAGKLMIPFASRDRFNPDADWSLGTAGKNVAYSVLKNYTIDPVSSNDLSSSYSTAKDVIDQIVADGKAGKPMNNLGYTANAEEAYDAAQYLSKEFAALDKEISAMWGEYNDIKASDMSDGEKARQMRALRRDQIIPLQQDAMALYEEFKMQYIDCDTLAMEIAGLFPWGLDRPTLE